MFAQAQSLSKVPSVRVLARDAKDPQEHKLLGVTFNVFARYQALASETNIAKEIPVVQPASLAVLAHHIGAPRFETYRKLALNHNFDAVRLYRWNLQMSGALHEALGIAEVFLRNAIDRELRTWNAAQPPRQGSPAYNTEWVKNPAGPLWAVLNPPSRGPNARRFSTYEDARKRAQKDLTERPLGHRRYGLPVDHDDLVAHMTFGTWKKLLAKKDGSHASGIGPYAQRRLWSEAIVRAFPHHQSPAVIYYWVDRLHTLRNRVAHGEPLCDTDVMSYHRTIVRLLRAIDPALGDWFSGISRIPEVSRRRPM